MNEKGTPVTNPIRFRLLAVLLALAAVQAPARAQTTAPADTLPPPVAALPAGLPPLMPGDLLQVRIWREPDLSGEFLVGTDGTVTLPKIGQRFVTGMPLDALREQLLALYRVSLRNPSISITPLRRVQVLGFVNRPGIFNVDPTLTLNGVLALAGGANVNGNLRRIRLVREGRVLYERVTAGSTLVTLDVRSGDQLYVGERSWADRNSGVLVAALISTATTIAVTIVSRL
jgi:polysaccharide export outer membrane protein